MSHHKLNVSDQQTHTDPHHVAARKDDLSTIENKEREPTPKQGKLYLRSLKVKDVLPPIGKIIKVQSDDSVSVGLKALVDNNILSVPVWDSSKQRYLGFIDILDIVCHVIDHTENAILQGGGSFAQLLAGGNKLNNYTCRQILDASGRNPYYPVDEAAPLSAALEIMVNNNVHRVPILDSSGELVSMITQSQVVRVINEHISKFPFTSATIGDIRLGFREVLSVNTSDKAYDAFKLILQKKVSGVAVVDNERNLVGNISASDIRFIGSNAEMLSHLFLPTAEYLKLKPKVEELIPGPICVVSSTTVEEVVTKLCLSKAHRVYVVDHQRKPIGVISLIDVLRAVEEHQ